MTNHTSHFKQLELSLAINHHDACYCAHNRAAFRREESRGDFGSYSVVLVNTLLWNKLEQTRGLGRIVVRCVVCFYDLNKNQGENNKGLYFPCTIAQGIWSFPGLFDKSAHFPSLFHMFLQLQNPQHPIYCSKNMPHTWGFQKTLECSVKCNSSPTLV